MRGVDLIGSHWKGEEIVVVMAGGVRLCRDGAQQHWVE